MEIVIIIAVMTALTVFLNRNTAPAMTKLVPATIMQTAGLCRIDNMSMADQIEIVFELGRAIEPAVKAELAALDADYGSTSSACYKLAETIKDKVGRYHAKGAQWYTVAHVQDVFRTRVVTDNLAAARVMADRLAKAAGGQVIAHDDYVAAPIRSFRAHNFTLSAANGALFELQVICPDMVAAVNAGGHDAYKAVRSGQVAVIDSAALYDQAWASYLARMGA